MSSDQVAAPEASVDVVDGAKSAASDAKAAAGKAADAATDAVKAAGAKLKGAADDVDFDELVAQTRTLAGGWTEQLKQAYRERPAVVIGAAVGAVVLTAPSSAPSPGADDPAPRRAARQSSPHAGSGEGE